MAGHSPSIDSKTLWGGGSSPFNVSYGKIMMWFFLVSDAFTFSGLLISYGFMRHSFAESWPVAERSFYSLSFYAWRPSFVICCLNDVHFDYEFRYYGTWLLKLGIEWTKRM